MPTAVTISIVGSFGNVAFLPNPIQAAVDDTIVWTNKDRTLHQIVLDDETMIGDIVPGASSAPMSLTRATVAYRCTIHPSMVGSINGPAATEPTPPPYEPPPMDDPYYGYRRPDFIAR
jgi:plastocyanin